MDNTVTEYVQPEGVMCVQILPGSERRSRTEYYPYVKVYSGPDGLKLGSRVYTVERVFFRRSDGQWQMDLQIYNAAGLRVRGGGLIAYGSPTAKKLHAIVMRALSEFEEDRPDWREASRLLRLTEKVAEKERELSRIRKELAELTLAVTALEKKLAGAP